MPEMMLLTQQHHSQCIPMANGKMQACSFGLGFSVREC